MQVLEKETTAKKVKRKMSNIGHAQRYVVSRRPTLGDKMAKDYLIEKFVIWPLSCSTGPKGGMESDTGTQLFRSNFVSRKSFRQKSSQKI